MLFLGCIEFIERVLSKFMALMWAYLVAKVDTGTNKMLENLSATAVELRFVLEGERFGGMSVMLLLLLGKSRQC